RPNSVEDLLNDLAHLGLTNQEANSAPVNLARLLLRHLEPENVTYLARSLEQQGFRSAHSETTQRQTDLIQEYCYTAVPNDWLADNCTAHQLIKLADELGLDPARMTSRKELIAALLTAVGFLCT